EYMRNNNILYSYMEGIAASFSSPYDKMPRNSFMLTRVFEKIDCERFWVKPAGNYLCYLHKGSYDDFVSVCKQIEPYVEENGLKLSNNILYSFDMVNYLDTSNPDEYVCRYEIRVE
ncbi:MAG: hypothetical protein ACOX7J_07100, partial [Bacillota bacterium]